MLMAALHSRSEQITTASRIIFVNWAAGLQLWLTLQGAMLTFGYIIVDAVTVALFFRMARGKWFPAPLCFMHGVLVIYHFGTLFNMGGLFWEKFILNRAFDIELIYITGCALFRIIALNRGGGASRA